MDKAGGMTANITGYVDWVRRLDTSIPRCVQPLLADSVRSPVHTPIISLNNSNEKQFTNALKNHVLKVKLRTVAVSHECTERAVELRSMFLLRICICNCLIYLFETRMSSTKPPMNLYGHKNVLARKLRSARIYIRQRYGWTKPHHRYE